METQSVEVQQAGAMVAESRIYYISHETKGEKVMLQVGEEIVLLKGTRVGMGTLKHATRARIETVQHREDGSPIYQAVWVDSKGKPRSTWIDDSQQTDRFANRVANRLTKKAALEQASSLARREDAPMKVLRDRREYVVTAEGEPAERHLRNNPGSHVVATVYPHLIAKSDGYGHIVHHADRPANRTRGRGRSPNPIFAVYGDKVVSMDYVSDPKQRFALGAMRAVDNAGEGYVVDGSRVYHVSRAFRSARPVTGEVADAVLARVSTSIQ